MSGKVFPEGLVGNHMKNFDFYKAIDALKLEVDRIARTIGTTYEQEEPHAIQLGVIHGTNFKNLLSEKTHLNSSTQLGREFIRWQIARLEDFRKNLVDDTGTNLYELLPVALGVGAVAGLDVTEKIKDKNETLSQKRSATGARAGEFHRVVKHVTVALLEEKVIDGEHWLDEQEMLSSVETAILKVAAHTDYKGMKRSNWSSQNFLDKFEDLRSNDELFHRCIESIYSKSEKNRKTALSSDH